MEIRDKLIRIKFLLRARGDVELENGIFFDGFRKILEKIINVSDEFGYFNFKDVYKERGISLPGYVVEGFERLGLIKNVKGEVYRILTYVRVREGNFES